MYTTSSTWVLGYTVVVAPPAQAIPRSARIHSILVLDAMATRCSRASPSATKPAAHSWTAVWACVHVMGVHVLGPSTRSGTR